MVATMSISQREPVHFRVLSFDPNPIQEITGPYDYIVLIQRAEPGNRMKINFAFRADDLVPFMEALQTASQTQAVYWVDWNYEDVSVFDHRPRDSTDWRMLRAVADQQIVEAPNDDA